MGYILGALEGLCSAHLQESEEGGKCRKLVKEVRETLAIENIFGREWWGEDGIWKYEVQGKEDEVTFREVVDAHPLVRRWVDKVDEEMKIAGVKVGRFTGREWEEGRVSNGEAEVG